MTRLRRLHPATVSAALALLLGVIFTALVLHLQRGLSAEIHRKLIERDAAVLHPVVLHGLAQPGASHADDRLAAVLRSAGQRGLLAVELFDADGNLRRALPPTGAFPALPMEDTLELLASRRPISRYHAAFRVQDVLPAAAPILSPVLEVLLPLELGNDLEMAGVARYHFDARGLAVELATIDAQVQAQTRITLLTGLGLIVLVISLATLAVTHAQRLVADRNERLLRANFELTLAAKVSAVGQITAHLLHGLQGPVAGLRTTLADAAAAATPVDLEALRHYTTRLQSLIEEVVELLGNSSTSTTYEVSGDELVAKLQQRTAPLASSHGVNLRFHNSFSGTFDNHLAGVVGLIGHNLVENAVQFTPRGGTVEVQLVAAADALILRVTDEGPGVAPALRPALFEPGRTTRPEGSGLGLALSRLIARQIGGRMELKASGPTGSTFELTLPGGKR